MHQGTWTRQRGTWASCSARSRKRRFVLAALVAATVLSAAALAVTGSGSWVLTPEFECDDPEIPGLICAKWDYGGGVTTPPCCITLNDLSQNRPVCSSYRFQ